MTIQEDFDHDSSFGSDDIPVTGILKKTRSTLFGIEAEEHLDLDEFPIVFYEPKSKDKANKNNQQQTATPEKKKKF